MVRLAVAEQRLLGPLGLLSFWSPMVNKTPNNVVGYFMIFFVFSFLIMGIILDFKVIIMGILLVKLAISYLFILTLYFDAPE